MGEALEEQRYWLYENSDPLRSKLSTLDTLCTDLGSKLRLIVMSGEKDLDDILQDRSPTGYEWETIFEEDQVKSIHLQRRVKSSKNLYEGKFLVLDTPYDKTYIVVSDETRNVFRTGIKRFFEQFYPLLSRPRMTSTQLKQVIDDVAESTENEIRTEKLVGYRSVPSDSKKKRGERCLYRQTLRREL